MRIAFLPYFLGGIPVFAQVQNPDNATGPNCHSIHMVYSKNAVESYQHVESGIINSASVPDAVGFRGKNLIY